VTGQDGYYLREICARHALAVYGVSRSGDGWIEGDVSDSDFVQDIVRTLRCSHVFHLAANSTTRIEAIYQNHAAIASGTINILESCRKYSPGSRVFLAGSALQFESNGLPVCEVMPFAASSGYVIARNYSVFAARYYRSLGLRTYVGYFCHHDSPLRAGRHLNVRILRSAQRIRTGSRERLTIDHPHVIKEFNFAGDIMEAVWLMVNQDRVFEAVIGSGLGHPIVDWVRICFERVGLDWREHVDSGETGRPEFERLVADASVVHSLGWRPRVDIRELAELMAAGT
jgi:GDPmannose 4,6-dehydratase